MNDIFDILHNRRSILADGQDDDREFISGTINLNFQDCEVIFIKSNLCSCSNILLDGKSYMIWDEAYWDMVFRFLALMGIPIPASGDKLQDDLRYHEVTQWLIGMFLTYLSNRYDKIIDLSSVLDRDIAYTGSYLFETVFAHEIKHEGRKESLRYHMQICKMMTMYHEAMHLIKEKNEKHDEFSKYTEWVKSALKTVIDKGDCRIPAVNSNTIVDSNIIRETLIDICQGPSNELSQRILDELVIDAMAIQEACSFWVRYSNQEYDMSLFDSLPLFLEVLRTFGYFNAIFNAVETEWSYYCKHFQTLKDFSHKRNKGEKSMVVGWFGGFRTIGDELLVDDIKTIKERRYADDLMHIIRDNIFWDVMHSSLFLTYRLKGSENSRLYKMNGELGDYLHSALNSSLLDPQYISTRIQSAFNFKKNNASMSEPDKRLRRDYFRKTISGGISVLGFEKDDKGE